MVGLVETRIIMNGLDLWKRVVKEILNTGWIVVQMFYMSLFLLKYLHKYDTSVHIIIAKVTAVAVHIVNNY